MPLPRGIQPPPGSTLFTGMSDQDTSAHAKPKLDVDPQWVLAGLECDNSLASLALTLIYDLGFEEWELAMLTGVSRAELATESGKKNATPHMDRLDDLAAIAALLIRNGGISPGLAPLWFRSSNPDLRGARPLDALRERGFLPVYSAAETACEVMAAREQDLAARTGLNERRSMRNGARDGTALCTKR